MQQLEGCGLVLLLRNPRLPHLLDATLQRRCDTGWVCPDACQICGSCRVLGPISTYTVQRSSPGETEMMSWQKQPQQTWYFSTPHPLAVLLLPSSEAEGWLRPFAGQHLVSADDQALLSCTSYVRVRK